MSDEARRRLPMVLGALAAAVVIWRVFFSGGGEPGLDSLDVNKRLVAMESLFEQDSDQARTRLRAMAADPDPRVVLQSIRGMGSNRDLNNRRHLQTFAAEAKDPIYRREAIVALSEYEDVNVSEFTAVLGRDSDPQARAGAAQALARRADRSTIPAMYTALTDPDAEVRIWAITGIKNITYTGFVYDPAQPPEQQREVIGQIGAFLKRNKFM